MYEAPFLRLVDPHGACGPFLNYRPLGATSGAIILPVVTQNIGIISKLGAQSEKHECVLSTLFSWRQLATLPDITFWKTIFQDQGISEVPELISANPVFRRHPRSRATTVEMDQYARS